MLYFLHGPSSIEASKKILEIKKAFFKKNPNFLLEEVDGDDDQALHLNFFKFIENPSLFSQKRLLVFKNTLSNIPNTDKFIVNNIDFLKTSSDIFLFSESNLEKNSKIFELLKKNSVKTQEVKETKTNTPTLRDNFVFRIADKIFSSQGIRALLSLEDIKNCGVDSKSLVNVIFWKIKKMAPKSRYALDIAHSAILADLNLKIDKKNEHEHLSRLVILIASKV